MALINCPECGHKISDKSVSCTNCGLPSSKMILVIDCPECSEPVYNQNPSCGNCGFPIAEPPNNVPPPLPNQNHTTIVQVHTNRKSRGVAIVLALFLGGLGIHKFYLNQPFWGILYLLFCWTFIPAVISLFEALMLLFTDDTEFNKRFG